MAALEAQAALAPVIDYVAPSPAAASEHISEQIVDVPAPQIMGKIVVSAPQLQEEIAEVIQPIPPECTSEHIVEQSVAESPDEAGSCCSAGGAAGVAAAAVGESAGEGRPPGRYSATQDCRRASAARRGRIPDTRT